MAFELVRCCRAYLHCQRANLEVNSRVLKRIEAAPVISCFLHTNERLFYVPSRKRYPKTNIHGHASWAYIMHPIYH